MDSSGVQQNCEACAKTVYLVDQVTADGIMYHKSCFRCRHCNRILKLSDFSSNQGVPYCKRHAELLFRRTGSLSRSFEGGFKKTFDAANLTKPINRTKPEIGTAPKKLNKISSLFAGTREKCVLCSKIVYPLEKVSVEGIAYHKSCFKCSHGGCSISPSNYAAIEGTLYCKHHYTQLFKEKGNYSHLSKTPSLKATVKAQADI